jgi:hypothetical protein
MDDGTKRRVDAMWESLGISREGGGRQVEATKPLAVDDTAARVAGR